MKNISKPARVLLLELRAALSTAGHPPFEDATFNATDDDRGLFGELRNAGYVRVYNADPDELVLTSEGLQAEPPASAPPAPASSFTVNVSGSSVGALAIGPDAVATSTARAEPGLPRKDQAPTPDISVDVLLVVATDVEYEAVMAEAEAVSGRTQPERDHHGESRTYSLLGAIGGATVAVVQTEAGSATPGGSLTTIQAALRETAPRALLLVGIAFGVNRDEQKIGGVLVSHQVSLYELQRVGTDAAQGRRLIFRGDRVSASPKIRSRLRQSRRPLASEFSVDFGLRLSGDKLVDNVDYRGELAAHEPEAMGGEMEAAGLHVAALESPVEWCVVKAICDFADGQKKQNKKANQALAAHNAARLVFHAIAAGGFAAAGALCRP